MLSYTQMKQYVSTYMTIYQSDRNSRFRSYDHCHTYFADNRFSKNSSTIDTMALHLFAFLGSWGMLCRGAFLMQKDYKILIPVIKILIKSNYTKLFELNILDKMFNDKYNKSAKSNKEEYVDLILELIEEIRSYFLKNNHCLINTKANIITDTELDYHVGIELKKYENVSDTLISKILIVTLACLPAYDNYVVKGMKAEGCCGKLNKKSIENLFNYCNTNRASLKSISTSVKSTLKKSSGYKKLNYSTMKVLDMLFWEYGYDLS